MQIKNKLIYTISLVVVVFLVLTTCDSYSKREKLVAELSSIFYQNKKGFDDINSYFLSDSLFHRFSFGYKNNKIKIEHGEHSLEIDSIVQMRDNSNVYRILVFMQNNNIRMISGHGAGGWISLFFEDYKYPCFNFNYSINFNPEDENIKRKIENIKDTKTNNWIYVLMDGWYIRGVKCF